MNAIVQFAAAAHAWLADLSPLFAFLLALPFALAAIGLAADALEPVRQLQSSASR